MDIDSSTRFLADIPRTQGIDAQSSPPLLVDLVHQRHAHALDRVVELQTVIERVVVPVLGLEDVGTVVIESGIGGYTMADLNQFVVNLREPLCILLHPRDDRTPC